MGESSSTTLPLTEKLNLEQQISPSYDYPDGFVSAFLLLAVLTAMIVALLYGREASD
jgi:hypothetical protein